MTCASARSTSLATRKASAGRRRHAGVEHGVLAGAHAGRSGDRRVVHSVDRDRHGGRCRARGGADDGPSHLHRSGRELRLASGERNIVGQGRDRIGDADERVQKRYAEMAAMPHSVKFNTDAVLRMDAISRAELHEKRLRTKTRTVNEVRVIEDEDPFPDPIYDEPGIPGEQLALPLTQGGS